MTNAMRHINSTSLLNTIAIVFKVVFSKKPARSVAVLIGMVIAVFFEMLSVAAIIPAISALASPESFSTFLPIESFGIDLNNPEHRTLILVNSVILLGVIYFIKGIYLSVFSLFQNRYIYSTCYHISIDLFAKYLSSPNYKDSSSVGIRNVTTETWTFATAVLAPLFVLAVEAGVLISVLVLLALINLQAMILFAFIFASSFLVFNGLTQKRVGNWGSLKQKVEGERIKWLQESFRNIKDIKIYEAKNYFLSNFETKAQSLMNIDAKRTWFSQMPRLWFEGLGVLTLTSVILVEIYQGSAPAEILTSMAVFAAAGFRLLPSASKLLGAVQIIKFGQASAVLIDCELDRLSLSTDRDSDSLSFNRELICHSIVFRYSANDAPILCNLDFSIKPGQKIGIVGASGTGKSTLVDVICGFGRADKGLIQADGVNIWSNIDAWRQLVGYVHQDVTVTEQSLAENIAFGVLFDNIDTNKVRECLQLVELETFVDGLADGIFSQIGEGGVNISGGQRQRLGIARALYKNPKLLVFDESTGALDLDTERSILDKIFSKYPDIACLSITHRSSALIGFDQVFRLRKGQLESNE